MRLKEWPSHRIYILCGAWIVATLGILTYQLRSTMVVGHGREIGGDGHLTAFMFEGPTAGQLAAGLLPPILLWLAWKVSRKV